MSADANVILTAMQKCRRFISTQQVNVMSNNLRGEEGDWFREKFSHLARMFDTMPKVYEQEAAGENALVYMHYFHGSGDWYITERDTSAAQHQAFGLAAPFGDEGEMGYISIVELIRAGVDFDLHWTPIPLKLVREQRAARAAA